MSSNVIPVQRPAAESDRDPEEGPAVYTVEEAARLLRLARSTAYDLVRDGTIPARRLGRRWVVPCVRFHAWLDADQVTLEEVY